MPLRSVARHLENAALTSELFDRSLRDERLLLRGGNRVTRSLITTALAKCDKRPLLVIVPTMEEAGRWTILLENMGWSKTLLYPTSESSPYENIDTTTEIIWGQLQVLSELILNINTKDIAIIATERSLQPHLPNPSLLKAKCIKIDKNNNPSQEELITCLIEHGYERVNTVEAEGTWSRRGDIIDLFPVSSELPVRLEYFGDELDKIREFDPCNQRSLDSIDGVYVTPTGFNPLIAEGLRCDLPDSIALYLNENSLNQLIEGNTPEGMKRLMGFVWEKPSSLIDYLPEDTCIAIDEKKYCITHGQQWLDHVKENYDDLVGSQTNRQSNLPATLHREINSCLDDINRFYGFDLAEIIEKDNHPNEFDLSSRPLASFPNQFGRLSQEIKQYRENKVSVWIISAQPSRTSALLEEHELITKFVANKKDLNSIERIINDNTPVVLKAISNADIEGIYLPAWKISLITDKEVYGQKALISSAYVRKRKQSSSKSVNPNKMRQGDYVVHRNHGIGKFIKIDKLIFNGEMRDYLVVQYLDGKLSVAADQLGSLGRYRSTSDQPPKLNKMGGSTWNKLKERTKKNIRKVAIDLVRLYAERTNLKGFAFPPDGPWQNEMEESFPYDPTTDQLKAVVEVKNDMEKESPMDRLICGDVGFGKTEVAIRAIFKAITSGKQTALLAPTTILSQQHWRTLSDRFAPYPIKVALLNRFKNSSERKEIINGIKNGSIDAVIGTHQLLSKNVEFKNLGLLVVDEEQRFGVNQKERIKTIRKDVDVLTLSATPIPRTLYMSLSGVREMSQIITAPPLRRPIKTHLAEHDYEVIRSAISQELDRGGQIFYVVPRVEGIDKVLETISMMLPKLRILVAHGQMPEGELEKAMIAFNAGECDLMLCTTIIESGLDIPRVNTILIEDSHKFGLSQLYQLRGRVGRSGIQAHAWLFYPNSSTLSETARQRLRAIQEFSQLGSGYQLAMRDMEIRGVGNILGVEQSGQLEAIGFDLYMDMLQESLAEIQGQNIPKVDETQIDLPVTAFIPLDWINNGEEKIAAYRSASECKSEKDLLDLALSWTDRYGLIPDPVQTLLELMKLKIIARECGFSRIRPDKQNVILETPMEEPAFRLIRQGLAQHLHGRFVFKAGKGSVSNVIVRGVGVLPINKQIEQLKIWFYEMSLQLLPEKYKKD